MFKIWSTLASSLLRKRLSAESYEFTSDNLRDSLVTSDVTGHYSNKFMTSSAALSRHKECLKHNVSGYC